MNRIRLLIVGGGAVAHEKLTFLLKSSPNANVTVLTIDLHAETRQLIDRHTDQVTVIFKAFHHWDVIDYDMIIAATNVHHVNRAIYCAAKRYDKIINVADTPDLCDFYMGGIVTKGHLKVAISTNGKSPTFAKRLRQILEDTLPDETSKLLDHLQVFRNRIKGDFANKVNRLNEHTKSLLLHD